MRTQKQIEASRINGAKSRGPVTPMGKFRSSLNSLRHGRIPCSLTLIGPDAPQQHKLFRELCDEHQPVGFTELSLVESMAVAKWRQYRVLAAANIAIDIQAEIERQNAPAPGPIGTDLMASPITRVLHGRRGLEALDLERSRLERDYHRALMLLYTAQDRRTLQSSPRAASRLSGTRERENKPDKYNFVANKGEFSGSFFKKPEEPKEFE